MNVDRDRAEFPADDQLALYDSLNAWALAMGDHATDAVMRLTGTVPLSHGPAHTLAHDPDVATAARKVALRWLRDQGVRV